MTASNYFRCAALGCFMAAAAHVLCIFWGPDGYRFFGAGEAMAQLAESGSAYPAQITSVIVFVLFVWGLYALSGAGVIVRLPLLRTALVLITTLLLCRGLLFWFIMPAFPDNSWAFWWVSSALCLLLGLLFACGLIKSRFRP